MMIKKIPIMIVLIMLFLVVPLVSAVGISSVYSSDYPVVVSPGDSKSISLGTLMANAEESDVNMEIELIEGSEIASLKESSFVVVAGSIDKTIDVDVNIADDAVIGSEYTITLKVIEKVGDEGEGMVGLDNSKTVSYLVSVQEPEADGGDEGFGVMWWVLGGLLIVVVVVIVIYFVVSRKKNDVNGVKKI